MFRSFPVTPVTPVTGGEYEGGSYRLLPLLPSVTVLMPEGIPRTYMISRLIRWLTATAGTEEIPMPDYLIVLRTRSGATLEEGNILELICQSDPGAVNLHFKTRRKDRGLGIPTALDLTIEVRGKGNSLDEAQTTFSAVAQGASNVLALGANAIVEQPPVVEIAYDVTPEHGEHDFFQRRHPEPPLEILQGRSIHPALLVPLYECFARHPDSDRLHQAAAHYNVALSLWRPGSELLAHNHLWIGIETLTPAFRKRECKTRGVDKEGLYNAWNLPAEQRKRDRMNKLDGEVRSTFIFQGDRNCYGDAKRASDGFEHGFLSLKEAHELAAKSHLKTAAYLRRAIFDLAGLDQETQNTLLNPPYNRPLERWHLDFQVRGKLVGAVDDLAPQKGDHPYLDWDDEGMSGTPVEGGRVKIEFRENKLTARLGKGVTLNVDNIQVFGPPPDDQPSQSEPEADN